MGLAKQDRPRVPRDLAAELGQQGIRRLLLLMVDSYLDLRDSGRVTATMPEDAITEEWAVHIGLRWRREPDIAVVPVHQKQDEEKAKERGRRPTIDFCFRDQLFSESYFGAECKLLDEGNADHMRAYLDDSKGIGRFLSCKYAAHTGAGAMVGYVRTGDSAAVAREISGKIRELKGRPTLKKADLLARFDHLYESVHSRECGVSPFRCSHLLLAFGCAAA